MKILYEDSNILAIDKPSGISVHGDGRSKKKTIVDWVLKNFPKMKNVGEPMRVDAKVFPRPGVVHRLDNETSGVLLLAKNQKAYEFLKNQFSAPALELKNKSGLADRQDRINKTYVAIVDGWVKNDRGIINKPIGRSPKDFRRHLAGRGVRGEIREAITQYRVLKRFEAPQKYTYLEIRPKTGRTHQIRVHMKFLNHPVVCDSLYNPNGICPPGIKRLALHAKSIEFKNLKGETVKVESSLPKEFIKLQK
ncbi:MAG: RluA family pseudouridine synthase [Candidatus Paceibacterota bacterium]|jgi:23S rRNA pseudouridine1911/1915/1917 synthase